MQQPVNIEQIKEELHRRVENGYNSSIVMARVTRDNVLFAHAGHFSCSPEKALFEIGSVTKLFTAHLAILLSEEGFFSLDDPIHLGFPLSADKDVSITLEQLLSHTSGICDPFCENYYNSENKNTVPLADYSWADIIEYLRVTPLSFSPGTEIQYSNLAYCLVGKILETATGKNYEELLIEKIFAPLGMEDTRVDISPQQQQRLIEGSEGGEKMPLWNVSHIPAFAALKSTAFDLSLYLKAFFFEQQIPSKVKNLLVKPILKWDRLPITTTLGWSIDEREGGTLYVVTGKTLGYSTFLGFSQETKEAIALLTDASFLDALGHHCLNPHFKPMSIHQEIRKKPQDLLKFTGLYKDSEGHLVEVILQNQRLFLRGDGEQPIPIYSKGEGLFFTKILAPTEQEIRFVFFKEMPAGFHFGDFFCYKINPEEE